MKMEPWSVIDNNEAVDHNFYTKTSIIVFHHATLECRQYPKPTVPRINLS